MTVDPRNIANGLEISSEGYCDQPFVVQTADGGWLIVMTTGTGIEGDPGQHVVSLKTFDRGQSWLEPVDVEPASEPESSWAVPLVTPGGRVYCFYTFNGDNLREVISDYGPIGRVDTLGYYAFRYSDDNGLTWSDRRYYIPVRKFRIDLENPYGGEVVFFWGVSKPIVVDGVVYFGFSKVGRFGDGFMTVDEGAFMRSDNILTEPDPEKIHWETLPEGDEGLRSPEGPISDEHNLAALSDGSLVCTFRTTQGHNCCSYSRDGGRTWEPPSYCAYEPGGRLLKHPRAANFMRRYSNGRFTLWFHNHGGRSYEDRNPAWILGGIEKSGLIHWSQPEILLYDDDPETRISYPDFIEEDGRVYVTETQKSIARVHEIDRELLEGIWAHDRARGVARDGLALDVTAPHLSGHTWPDMPDLRDRGGFSIEAWGKLGDVEPGGTILDCRVPDGIGVALRSTGEGAAEIVLSDGRTVNSWNSDAGGLVPGQRHHLVVTVDAGPRIIMFVIDGTVCDGAEGRQFGWGRFSPHLGALGGSQDVRLSSVLDGLRIYSRPLRNFEAIGNFRAGRE